MTYFKLYFDLLDNIELLGDAERGRLLTAILEYGRTGAAPQLSGNEKFVFPFLRAQFDRDEAAYLADERAQEEHEAAIAEARREAGRKGGSKRKQTEANASKAKQTEANASIKDKDKDKEEDKDNTKDEREARAREEEKPFTPPTVEEVRAFCRERRSRVNPERFVAYYKERRWKGVNDWKDRLISWEYNGVDAPALNNEPASYDIERAAQKARTTVPELKKRSEV